MVVYDRLGRRLNDERQQNEPGSFAAGQMYLIILPRSFTIRVTVTDGAGAAGSDTKVVWVLPP